MFETKQFLDSSGNSGLLKATKNANYITDGREKTREESLNLCSLKNNRRTKGQTYRNLQLHRSFAKTKRISASWGTGHTVMRLNCCKKNFKSPSD